MMRGLPPVIGSLVLATAAQFASAHGDWAPKHGGIMNDGETSFELGAKGKSVELYVEDHGTPIATKGAQGTLTVTNDGKSWSVPVVGEGTNRLKGTLRSPLVAQDRVVVKVQLGNGSIVAARYVIK